MWTLFHIFPHELLQLLLTTDFCGLEKNPPISKTQESRKKTLWESDVQMYTTALETRLLWSLLCSSCLHLFNQKYSQNVNYYYYCLVELLLKKHLFLLTSFWIIFIKRKRRKKERRKKERKERKKEEKGCITLIQSDSKDIYNITKDFYFKSKLF